MFESSLHLLYNGNLNISNYKGAFYMQKQSFSSEEILELKFDFDKEFPVIPPWGLYSVGADRHRLHFHNGLELGYCFSGSGMFFVNNKIIPFSKGDVSVIFQNEAHIAQSHRNDISEWKFVTIDIETLIRTFQVENFARIFAILDGSDDFINIVKASDEPLIVQLILEIINEMENKSEDYKPLVKSYIWTLLTKLTKIVVPVDYKDSKALKMPKNYKIISPAINYLTKNYFEDISVKKLSTLCTISEPHFNRLFKETLKYTPLEYLYNIRIKMACLLLESEKYSIMEISLQVGYTSITSFNRHFKRIKGISPKEWRKLNSLP